MFEEKKDQKDLQEISQKLLEACSEVAGASLEQKTWLSRNLVVKPGTQVDVPADVDDTTTDQEAEGEQSLFKLEMNKLKEYVSAIMPQISYVVRVYF